MSAPTREIANLPTMVFLMDARFIWHVTPCAHAPSPIDRKASRRVRQVPDDGSHAVRALTPQNEDGKSRQSRSIARGERFGGRLPARETIPQSSLWSSEFTRLMGFIASPFRPQPAWGVYQPVRSQHPPNAWPVTRSGFDPLKLLRDLTTPVKIYYRRDHGNSPNENRYLARDGTAAPSRI